MSKLSSVYICQQCNYKTSQFLGRCPECGTWNSLVESIEEKSSQFSTKNQELRGKSEIINLADIKKDQYKRTSTGMGEFDRVLGEGIVQGSVILVSGDPGIGKSTLLLQLALKESSVRQLADQSSVKADNEQTTNPCLYVAGEESAQQIKIRADRIKNNAQLLVLNETDVDRVTSIIEQNKYSLVIIDSIQTMETTDLLGAAGSVGQVRESAYRLQKLAKRLHIPIFLVGHINKEGSIAGPKTLEHLVDVVLSLEGDPTTSFRILRSSKNRFGSTDEVGIFEMTETGMTEVKNPSELFLSKEPLGVPGSAIVPTLTGVRPLLVEIQALVTKSFLPIPTRRASGIDNNRLQLLVAVLIKRLKLPLYNQDIFVNVTGGIKVLEPAADLAICAAIISSFQDKPILKRTVIVGEVGLLGEIRPVRQINKRIQEAKKLGFTKIISPDNCKSLADTIKQIY